MDPAFALGDVVDLAVRWQHRGGWSEAEALLRWWIARDDGSGRATLLATLGDVLFDRHLLHDGDIDQADAVFADAAAAAAFDDDPAVRAHAIDGQALCELRRTPPGGDPAAVLLLLEQAYELAREGGEESRVGWVLLHLGEVHERLEHDPVRAEEAIASAHTVAATSSDLLLLAHTHAALGRLRDASGDVAAARTAYDESLRLREAIGWVTGTAAILVEMGRFLQRHGGEPAMVRTTLARAERLAAETGATLLLSAVRSELGALT